MLNICENKNIFVSLLVEDRVVSSPPAKVGCIIYDKMVRTPMSHGTRIKQFAMLIFINNTVPCFLLVVAGVLFIFRFSDGCRDANQRSG